MRIKLTSIQYIEAEKGGRRRVDIVSAAAAAASSSSAYSSLYETELEARVLLSN